MDALGGIRARCHRPDGRDGPRLLLRRPRARVRSRLPRLDASGPAVRGARDRRGSRRGMVARGLPCARPSGGAARARVGQHRGAHRGGRRRRPARHRLPRGDAARDRRRAGAARHRRPARRSPLRAEHARRRGRHRRRGLRAARGDRRRGELRRRGGDERARGPGRARRPQPAGGPRRHPAGAGAPPARRRRGSRGRRPRARGAVDPSLRAGAAQLRLLLRRREPRVPRRPGERSRPRGSPARACPRHRGGGARPCQCRGGGGRRVVELRMAHRRPRVRRHGNGAPGVPAPHRRAGGRHRGAGRDRGRCRPPRPVGGFRREGRCCATTRGPHRGQHVRRGPRRAGSGLCPPAEDGAPRGGAARRRDVHRAGRRRRATRAPRAPSPTPRSS